MGLSQHQQVLLGEEARGKDIRPEAPLSEVWLKPKPKVRLKPAGMLVFGLLSTG